MTSKSVLTSIWAALYQIAEYIELLFFSIKQTWSGNLQKMYPGMMLASNTLVAIQPKGVNEGMFGLNYFEGWSSSV